ncbi:contractile injection system protein, VgrG/Pvc8 family [Lysobacter sp. FW306-1B-D06B]|uniref:contractile injection system protein, VgrG/Pvc8 family n=1 Tax=Lysobacter sp. FW306-1B-D06B TaxID=3140250 RepID=UPI003140BE3B
MNVAGDGHVRPAPASLPERSIVGIVTAFEQDETGFRRSRYRATVESPLARLGLRHNSRIFQRVNATEILATLLKEHRVIGTRTAYSAAHEPREYCVQYRESDSEFFHRLATEEGIVHWHEVSEGLHAQKDMNRTVLNDSSSTVKGNDTDTVVGTRTVKVTGEVSESYEAGESKTISAGGYTETITGNFTTTLTGNYTSQRDGTWSENVTQTSSRTVTGAVTETLHGGRTVMISAAGDLHGNALFQRFAFVVTFEVADYHQLQRKLDFSLLVAGCRHVLDIDALGRCYRSSLLVVHCLHPAHLVSAASVSGMELFHAFAWTLCREMNGYSSEAEITNGTPGVHIRRFRMFDRALVAVRSTGSAGSKARVWHATRRRGLDLHLRAHGRIQRAPRRAVSRVSVGAECMPVSKPTA